jgi:ATP-dependent DNA ligase
MQFSPAIPTRGTKVPASPDWIHEIKYDGFRLIVHRDGDRVRLLTCNGHDGPAANRGSSNPRSRTATSSS